MKNTLIFFFCFLFLIDAKIYAPSNLAIEGYDPVSYFFEGSKKGNEKWQYKYKGVTWHFSSKENLEIFKHYPEQYSPQYGGYCAYAIAEDYIYKSDPDIWTIHQGKLYLNYNKSVRAKWSKDINFSIKQGDINWIKKTKEIEQ